jgi:hypothetical protein
LDGRECTPHPNPLPRLRRRGDQRFRLAELVGIAGVFFSSFVFTSQPLRAADWTLTDSSFHTSRISIESIAPDGIHLAPATSQPSVIPWNNCLELTRSGDASTAASQRFDLYLRSGDHLGGQPVSVDGDTLHWHNARLDLIDIPVGSIAAIAKSDWTAAGLDDQRSDDVLTLSNGDTTHGVVTQVDPSGVGLQSGDATTTLPWDAVTAVLLSSQGATAGAKSRAFRVILGGNESITVSRVDLSGNSLTLHLGNKTLGLIPVDAVTAIEQINGPVTWISSLKPTENIYRPFFSENYPARFDSTVADGKPISEKYPGFHHGIGCHSYSKITYDLGAGFTAFRTQYAIDSDSPLADVTVGIYLDGKSVYVQKNVKAGPPAPVVSLPLQGAKTISLEVDYGENYATEDRFVWLDPALLKKNFSATDDQSDGHR